MRTTIDLDPALLRQARALAARQGRTLSAAVNDALRASLSARPASRSAVELPVVEGQGPAPSWSEIQAMLAEHELSHYAGRTIGRVAEV